MHRNHLYPVAYSKIAFVKRNNKNFILVGSWIGRPHTIIRIWLET